MQRTSFVTLIPILFILSLPGLAQKVTVDISACRGTYEILKTMQAGDSESQVSAKLDALLETRPYQVMFQHYNRSWRPNHLPKDVFKRMILSLRFPNEYKAGENERADTMRPRWLRFYTDLPLYEKEMHQLETIDLPRLINEGVQYAQSWLPAGWNIPDFYFAVIPNGGSSAFSIEGSQGYDFFQLDQLQPGEINVNWLVGTVAHESHHLGIHASVPEGLSPADAMAYQVLIMCIPEGSATYFISGSPAGRAPGFPGAKFQIFTPDMTKAWEDRVSEEESLVQRQADMLDRAASGKLTQDEFNNELKDYWLNGAIGRAYVLGSEMFGAIYAAFGKDAVLSVMQDPRRFFRLYNAAIDSKPALLNRCARMPEKAVKQALAIRETH
jgi:hypothetical protein